MVGGDFRGIFAAVIMGMVEGIYNLFDISRFGNI